MAREEEERQRSKGVVRVEEEAKVKNGGKRENL